MNIKSICESFQKRKVEKNLETEIKRFLKASNDSMGTSLGMSCLRHASNNYNLLDKQNLNLASEINQTIFKYADLCFPTSLKLIKSEALPQNIGKYN